MLRKALAATAIAGAALATAAAPASAATSAVEGGMGGKATGAQAVPAPSADSAKAAAGVVDYALRNFYCDGDSVGTGSWQIEYGRSGVVRFGTVYQLQQRPFGAARYTNVRGAVWRGQSNFFPNDSRTFQVYFPAGPSTFRYWTPTFQGDYRVAVTHRFLTANGVWNIARQTTPGCRIT